jgi:hypothetical protein
MKLPEDFLDTDTLANLRVGERCYTTPWAMWVDLSMNCWLHPEYTAQQNPGGTVHMRVARLKDGYHVWPPVGEKYKPSAQQSYVSPDDTPWIPVVNIHH